MSVVRGQNKKQRQNKKQHQVQYRLGAKQKEQKQVQQLLRRKRTKQLELLRGEAEPISGTVGEAETQTSTVEKTADHVEGVLGRDEADQITTVISGEEVRSGPRITDKKARTHFSHQRCRKECR